VVVRDTARMALDRRRSIEEMFCIVCLWRPFDADGLEVMGHVKTFVGELFCDGSLAELRRVYSAGAAYSEQGGDVYSRGIQ